MFSTPVDAEFSQKEPSGSNEPESVEPEAPPQVDQVPEEGRDNLPAGQKLETAGDKQADRPVELEKTKPDAETASKVKAAPKTKAKAGKQAKAKTADKVKPTAKKDGKQTSKTQAKQADKKNTKPAAKQKIKVASEDPVNSRNNKVEL